MRNRAGSEYDDCAGTVPRLDPVAGSGATARTVAVEGKRFPRARVLPRVLRRELLATAVAAGAATGQAGCLGAGLGGGEEKPVVLRATPAAGDETDVRCRLTEDFVADHPPLAEVLSRASGNEPIEWERVGITEETAEALVHDLQHHCEATGGAYRGLYRYRDGWFFLSVSPRENATVGIDDPEGTHDH